jgi:hypothetical protein
MLLVPVKEGVIYVVAFKTNNVNIMVILKLNLLFVWDSYILC